MKKKQLDQHQLITLLRLTLNEIENNYELSENASVTLDCFRLISRMTLRSQQANAFQTLNSLYFDNMPTVGATGFNIVERREVTHG